MKAPRTALQLQSALDTEFAWRQIEIHALREATRNANGMSAKTLLRAAVPISYAHWEGFVKVSACLYVKYLSSLGMSFGGVRTCFRGLAALGHVQTISGIKKRIFVTSELLEKINSIEKEKFRAPLEEHLDRIGNLNYELFEQIVSFLGLDVAQYVTRKQFIDERLLVARNKIAHGEYIDLDQAGFEDLSNEVLLLLRWVKTDIENAAATKSYLAI